MNTTLKNSFLGGGVPKIALTPLLGLIAILIAGCASSQFRHVQAIPSDQIHYVVDDMKRQVSIYVGYQNSEQGTKDVIAKTGVHACGYGLVDFDIKSVKLEILTELDSTVGAGVSGGGPVGTGTLNGGLSASRNANNLQVLTLSANLLDTTGYLYEGRENINTAPIAATLIGMREALVRASKVPNRVCFKSDDDPNAENTYKIAVKVINKVGGDVGLGLAPLTLSASGESQSTTGNTITVTFAPHAFTPREMSNARQHDQRGDVAPGTGVFNRQRPSGQKVQSPEQSQPIPSECVRNPQKCSGIWEEKPEEI